MNAKQNQAYFEGMLRAAFGATLFSGVIAEWQIDVVKEAASRAKEEEIEHLAVSELDKEEMKRQWKEWLEAFAKGIKEELRREGRME